jgi:hypothetical protein
MPMQHSPTNGTERVYEDSSVSFQISEFIAFLDRVLAEMRTLVDGLDPEAKS